MFIIVKRIVVFVALLALFGCEGTLESARKAEQPIPARLMQSIKAKGMTAKSPIMMRIFKEEGILEVWKQKKSGRYGLLKKYEICKWSGKLGPKYMEGDRQAPEGFYSIRSHQLNPKSRYYLSFNLGFPNAYDRAHGRSGRHLMVHGACSSSGCYSMTDEQVAEIYVLARDALRGGQKSFQVQAFPFRMTPRNMARYRNDANIKFWRMLKEGYDHFELTKRPPKVDVCGRGYVFNQQTLDGSPFRASAQCPPMKQPDHIRSAYQSYQKNNSGVFQSALSGFSKKPHPSIASRKEAALVADWSKRRARGQKVSREPPSLKVEKISRPIPTPAQTSTESLPQKSAASNIEAVAQETVTQNSQAAQSDVDNVLPERFGGEVPKAGSIRNLFGG